MLSYEAALDALLAAAVAVSDTETVATLAAGGRILAADLVSGVDVPPADNSSMDGYAIRCADLATPGTRLRVAQRIAAGSVGHTLEPGTAARIFTGALVPGGADAVVMQEVCVLNDATLTVDHRPHPGEWIRRRGEDIAIGQTVLARGRHLGPAELGVAAAVGAARLNVFRRLRVALFSTGDELAQPGEVLKPGGIYNSNRYTLHALLEGMGCVVSDLGIVPDRLDATRAVLREAAGSHDLILTSGGVSVGEEDHVKPAVEAEGALALWKIAIKPGKPLAFGHVRGAEGGRAAFIGLPGNPVSSFVTFLMLVRPFIQQAQGHHYVAPQPVMRRADFRWNGDSRREFLRVRGNADGGLDLFPNQSAGVLTSCAWADGLVDCPPGAEISVGTPVRFLPFSTLL